MFAYDRCCHIILLILTINIFGRLLYLLNKHRNWSMEKSNLPKATPTDLAKPESETVSRAVVSDLYHPMDCSPPGSSVHGFSRQEYWSGLPFPLQGNLSDPGIEPRSPALQADSLPSEALGSILKSRDNTLLTQVHGVKAMVFPVVIYGCESWTIKKAERWSFQTVVLEKTLESLLDCKETESVNPKGNQPWIFIRRTDAEAETPVLWPPDAKSWLTGKDSDAGKD